MPLSPPLIAGPRNPRQAPEGVAVASVVFVPVAAFPPSPEDGQTVLLASDGLHYTYRAGLWTAVGGGGTRYVHHQVTASTTWTITHGLNARPSVTLVDNGGAPFIGDIAWPDLNTVVVTVLAPTSGYAYIN